MSMPRFASALALCLVAAALPAQAAQRNIVIFVADGLRYASVTPETAPTMAKLRQMGVDFTNSHAVYPTVTTVNGAVIATGHFPGDTGDYGNTLYTGFPVPCRLGAQVTFLEDDCILRDMKEHFPQDYLGQTTLIQAARAAGYNTIIVGKRGPAAIQDMSGLDSKDNRIDGKLGIFIDEATNHVTNLDGTLTKSTTLGGSIGADVLRATGMDAPSLTSTPNLTQQAYLLSATTQVLIPDLKDSGKPFVLFFWSRDPDTTQHGAIDSDGTLLPGINSYSGRAAIANADNDLKGILDALDQYGLADNTDVFVILAFPAPSHNCCGSWLAGLGLAGDRACAGGFRPGRRGRRDPGRKHGAGGKAAPRRTGPDRRHRDASPPPAPRIEPGPACGHDRPSAPAARVERHRGRRPAGAGDLRLHAVCDVRGCAGRPGSSRLSSSPDVADGWRALVAEVMPFGLLLAFMAAPRAPVGGGGTGLVAGDPARRGRRRTPGLGWSGSRGHRRSGGRSSPSSAACRGP